MKQSTTFARRRGFTLVELMVVLGVITAGVAIAATRMDSMQRNAEAMGIARNMGDLIHLARGEAGRTGQPQVLIFDAPILGADLTHPGTGARIIALHFADVNGDGIPGPSEVRSFIGASDNYVVGATGAGVPPSKSAPLDQTGNAFDAEGISFQHEGNTTAAIAFGRDGIPVSAATPGSGAVDVLGSMGSGAGTLYIESAESGIPNGRRIYAIQLTALGSVRISAWDRVEAEWK